MAKAREFIGEAPCMCCGRPAPVKAQSNGLAIQMCNWCDFKGQSFSADSDRRMRARITPGSAPVAEKPVVGVAPAPVQTPAAPPKKQGSGLFF